MSRIHLIIQSINLSFFLSCFAFSELKSFSDLSQIGSGMTDLQEARVLSEDVTAAGFIQKASQDYRSLLSQYQSGSLNWAQLQTSHDKIFSDLILAIKSEIKSSEDEIHVIASDYDAEHELAFNQHIQFLLGLAQKNLEIPVESVFLPSLPNEDLNYPNLIIGGDLPISKNWQLSSGFGTLVNGQIVTQNPNGASFSQIVQTVPGLWYLISGDITGAYEGKESVYSGTISVIGANKEFPESSDELDEEGLHRRYFWVEANNSSMTIYLSGSGSILSDNGPFFQNISVRTLKVDCATSEGQIEAMALAQMICPPVSTTGSQEVGLYPQIERKLELGDNLIDGSISIVKNVDQSALGNAGHPYWYFGKKNENPVDKEIEIINGLNGSHGLILPAGADPTTNGPLPIPKGDYVITCDVYVPENSEGNMRISFCGTNLNDGSQLEKFYQDFDGLPSGKNRVSLTVASSLFPDSGVFFRPAITFENKGPSFINLYNIWMKPVLDDVYTKINSINPYNPDRSWYNLKGCNLNYDFKNGEISPDWAIALTGNTMFAANVMDVTVTDQGIQLDSHSQEATLYDGGGIQSTQLIDPMRDFSFSVAFVVVGSDPGYEPTFAVWTYGESQRGPDDPLSHRNGSASDLITEFDCEMGSDPNEGQDPPNPDKMYMRPGSYIGYEAGGHSEILPPGAKWILMPNFWQKNSKGTYDHYQLTMSGSWISGDLILTRSIEDIDTQVVTELCSQNLGKGPFSPMYIKIGLENPDWNAKSHLKGEASLAIQNIAINQGAEIPENTAHKISLSEMDYVWFTPGGGGGLSYTSFLPRSL